MHKMERKDKYIRLQREDISLNLNVDRSAFVAITAKVSICILSLLPI